MYKIFLTIKLIFLLTVVNLHAQNYDDLFLLYQNKKLEKLQTRLSELEKRHFNAPEIKFFKTLFSEDGDLAIKTYQELYKSSGSPLKNLLAQKLSEYYYAQGYYVKAQEYSREAGQNFVVNAKDISNNADYDNKADPESENKPRYIIQVGAFGVEKNAQDLASVLRRRKIEAEIVQRNINDTILHCVWIQGDEEYSATKEIAEEIKSKFNLTYRILKP